MANPLFNMLMGGGQATMPQMPQMTNMSDAMTQLRNNPAQMIKQAGYNVPEEIAGNPQATVMHLLQSGQIGGQAMQRIQPMLNMLMGRR